MVVILRFFHMSGYSSSDSPGRRTQWYVPSRMVSRCERLFRPTSLQIEHLFLNLVGAPASSMQIGIFSFKIGSSTSARTGSVLLKSDMFSFVGTSIGLGSIRILFNRRSTRGKILSSSISIVIFMSGAQLDLPLEASSFRIALIVLCRVFFLASSSSFERKTSYLI